MENRKRDPLTLKVLTQEFRDSLYQLSDREILKILRAYEPERRRLEDLLSVITCDSPSMEAPIKPAKVYLAANFERQAELRDIRDKLVNKGYPCTSRWLETETAAFPAPSISQAAALIDMDDVLAANIFVLFHDGKKGRGGRDTEFGIALASHKWIVLVGPAVNVFHHHPLIRERYGSVSNFLASWNVL